MSSLDNPVWSSLSETHRSFSIGQDSVKFYHPDYCPFGGFDSSEHVPHFLSHYATLINNFFIVGGQPPMPAGLRIEKELVCLQMVIDKRLMPGGDEPITLLSDQHHDALFHLVNLVQPGYFRPKTPLLGDYFGIFKNDMLIAVSGERMKMNDFAEVSAVVTHPDHVGNGYAKKLVSHGVNHILDQGKIPYLHVVKTNQSAIALYEKLGFKTRRKISFWNVATESSISG